VYTFIKAYTTLRHFINSDTDSWQLTKAGQIINAEVTVVQKPDQGTIRQRGRNPLPGSFFGSFLLLQKRTFKPFPKTYKHTNKNIPCYVYREIL